MTNVRKTRYYLVCPDNKTFLPTSFRTVREGDGFAITHMRGKGYCAMRGERVISLVEKGIIKEE